MDTMAFLGVIGFLISGLWVQYVMQKYLNRASRKNYIDNNDFSFTRSRVKIGLLINGVFIGSIIVIISLSTPEKVILKEPLVGIIGIMLCTPLIPLFGWIIFSATVGAVHSRKK